MAIITETGVSNEPEQPGIMAILAAGIPLSLLIDLVDHAGPQSADLALAEGGDASWLAAPRDQASVSRG